jgi:hypothetical protein
MPTERSIGLQICAWTLSLVVAVLAVMAWGSSYNWHVSWNAYIIFPLLGLLAYSLMWAHYVCGAVRQLMGLPFATLKTYYQWTGYTVLALICLHPGLLIYQRFRDGYGLPPLSYERYVARGLGWITLLGTASLLIFLAFEFRRVYGRRTWWHYVTEAGDVAMLAIFYHGLKLGSQLQMSSWFRTVWWFYGLTLIAVLIYSYWQKYQTRTVVRP